MHVQPSDPSQQWHTGQPNYGPPTGAQPPQRGGPYAGQTSGVPYPGQPSAPPYPGQPSAPPYQGPPYQGPPYQGPPYQGQPYQGPQYPGQPATTAIPVAPKKRGGAPVALIVGIGALVIVVVAIVAVTALRSGSKNANNPIAAASPTDGKIDKCLVGKWKQTDYQKNVPLADTDVG